MLSFLLLFIAAAQVFSFPQNYGHEGNFGYDPFGGTFPQHVPVNPEYVPPVEYPVLPRHSKSKYESYVPVVDGKPIYIPEVYHDGFVFRDMTFPDPNEPLDQWQQDQSVNINPQSSFKAGVHVKKVKPHHSKKKQRHYPKGNAGARSSHKKPAVHKDEYDDPVVVQSFSKMEKPVVHKPTYDYESIKKFLEEDHDFSELSKDHELPVEIIIPDDIKKEVAIEGLTKKENPAHKKPIKQKHTPVAKPVYPEYEEHKVTVADPYTKKEKPVTHKKPIKQKHTPVKPAYPEYEEHKPVEYYPLTKKPVAPQKPVLHDKPVFDKKPVDKEYNKHGIKIVEAFTENENEATLVAQDEELDDEFVEHEETPVIEAFSNKKKHEEKPKIKYDSTVVEALSEEKPVLHEEFGESAENIDGNESVEELTHKKPVSHEKDKPVHPELKEDYEKTVIKTHVKHGQKKPPHDEYKKHKKGEHASHVEIAGKNLDNDEYEYDYDVPEVVDALTKGKHPEIQKGEMYDKPVKVIVQKEKHHPHKKGAHVKHPHPVHLIDEDHEEDNHEFELDDHVSHEETNHDDLEYDYDTPEVVEVLTKKEKPLPGVTYEDHDTPDVVEVLTKKEKVKVKNEDEYDEPVKVVVKKEKHQPHKDGHKKPPHPGHPMDKDDVEVDYEPVEEWSDDDKDYELGELESRDLEGSEESLDKDVDTFDGSGSVSEPSETPEGRSFLPVDPNVWSLMSNLHTQERRKFKSCLTPKNESGNCMPIQMCAVPNFASNIDELLNNVCVIDEVFIGICCPEFPVDSVKVQWDEFVESNKSDSFDAESVKECGKLPEVVNKTVAWPWMAPLVAASTGKVFCGGALINEQYVLSAAHCTKKIPHNRILIRLGSLDSDQKSDEDFEVVEIKRHAQYNPRNMANDIALLKLARRVPLGDFRSLICLPEDDDDYVDETAILLGWKGFSEKMDDIETLNVVSKETCQRKMGVIVADSVVCTQPRTEQVKCNDDSGAPLVIGKDKQFKVIGVLTWNRNDCDSKLPSIFTRVSEYRKWIKRHAV